MALIKCSECGHTISDKSRKCPKCGNPTVKEEFPVVEKEVKETPINNEVPTSKFIPKKKHNKRIIVIPILVVLILILGTIYFRTTHTSNTRSTEISNSVSARIDETSIQESVESNTQLTDKTPIQESIESNSLLTDESLTRVFLKLWKKKYGADREFIPYMNIEGYKIIKGDLNGDGYIDAVINAYATATPNEIANRNHNNKSFIFCFLNNGSHYELVSATKFPSIYFVTDINNMMIYTSYNDKTKDHNYKLEGDKLVEVIKDTEVQYEDSESQYAAEEEKEEESDIQIATEAQFPEGRDAMYKFIGKQIKYPTIAQENRIEGMVTVQFVVNEDGTLSDFEAIETRVTCPVDTINAPYKYLDKEALRAAKLLPNFIPAKTHTGKSIKSYYKVRINFKLS